MIKKLYSLFTFFFIFHIFLAKNPIENHKTSLGLSPLKNSKIKRDNFSIVSQNSNEEKKQTQEVINAFDALDSSGNYTQIINPNELTQLPIGIKENKNSVEYGIVVTKVKFTPEYAIIDVFARVRTPQQGIEGGGEDLYFGAERIKFSYHGKIIGDAKLSLLGDVHIPFNDKKWLLTLEGGNINKIDGNINNNNTFVSIDCDGIKELSLKGNIQISREVVVPIDPISGKVADEVIQVNGKNIVNRVRGDFSIKASDWNDILVKVNISPFAITSHTQNPDKGYFAFFVNNAILDLSDLRNDPSVKFPQHYLEHGYLIAGEKSWRGLFVETLQIALPQEFKTSKSPNKPITLAADLLLIDQYGVSGRFSANNVFPLEEGITSEEKARAYSLDKIGVDFAASRIIGANLEGQIKLPIQKEEKDKTKKIHLGYKGVITEEEYLLSTSLQDNLDFDLWRAKAKIAPGSSVELKVKKR